MTNERKARLFDDLVNYITEAESNNCKSEEEIKEIFLDLGFTEEEYDKEISL